MVDPIKGIFLTDLDEVQSVKENTSSLGNVSGNSKTTKSFSLGNVENTLQVETEKTSPSPMHMIKDQQEQKGLVPFNASEDLDTNVLSDQISQLKGNFSDLALRMEDKSLNFNDKDTQQALQVMQLLNQDLSEIATNTNQQEEQSSEEETGFIHKALNWCYSGEQVLHNALLFLSDQKGSFSGLGDYLKLQYAVQRATQRTELFASIMGITISSIKTIMTTQLG